MPWDFVGYTFAAAGAVVVALALCIGGVLLVGRILRKRRARKAMRRAGGIYIGENERHDAAAILDRVFPQELSTQVGGVVYTTTPPMQCDERRKP